MTDGERGSLLTDDDPVGAMRLATTVKFGQRAAALSGVVATGERVGIGLFDAAGSFGWPWPDITTCSSRTTMLSGDRPATPA
jgi:hypothetical protein